MRNKCGKHAMYIVLYAMKKEKRATHVNIPRSLSHKGKKASYTSHELVIVITLRFALIRRNKRATHVTYLDLLAIKRNN